MSLFGSVGKFFSNLVESDDDKKKKQQQQQQNVVATVPKQPAAVVVPQQITSQPTPPPVNGVNLPLQKFNADNPTNPANLPKVSADTLVKAPKPTGEVGSLRQGSIDSASAAAGVPLGVLRAGEGLAQGAVQLPKTIAHAGDWVLNKLTGHSGTSRITKAIDEHTAVAEKPLDWLAQKTDEASLAYGQKSGDSYKPAQIATNIATLVPGAVTLGAKAAELSKIEPLATGLGKVNDVIDAQKNASPLFQAWEKYNPLIKAKTLGKVDDVVENTAPEAGLAGESGGSPPNEIAPGVSSVNPNQVDDAAEQIVANTPPPAPLAPVEASASAAPDAPVSKTPVVRDPVDVSGGTLAPPVAPAPVASVAGEIAPVPPVIPSEPAPLPVTQPPVAPLAAPIEPGQPPAAVVAPPVAPEPVPPVVAGVEPQAVPGAAPAEAAATPQQPAAVVPGTAPNAPGIRQALEKQLGEAAKTVDDTALNTHEILSNEALDTAAKRVIATMSDDELVTAYGTGGAKFNDVSDVARGKAALERLIALKGAGSEEAAKAIDNIINASQDVISSSGRQLNYSQTFYDSLPREAKVSYLIRNIDKKNALVEGYQAIADDPELRQAVEAKFNDMLAADESSKEKIAGIEGVIQQVIDDPAGSGHTAQDVAALRKQLNTLDLARQANNGEMAKYYDTLVPKDSAGARAGDLGRTMMLGSVAGRFNDVVTTGANTAHTLLGMTGESLMGKVANAVGDTPGKYIDTLPSPRAIARGASEGLEKSTGEFGGKIYAEDLQKTLKSTNQGEKSQLLRSVGNGLLSKARRTIRAGAEFATNLSEGVKEAQLTRLAAQEGKQLGLAGDDLKAFTEARSALPSRGMLENATKLHEEVNNINDNPISSVLGHIADGLGKIPVVGEQIRNLTIPFTRWTGGQLWNAVTDKNVIANMGKVIKAAADGDNQAVVSNLSKLAVNTTATMTLGYKLAQSGVLTTKGPEGYSDDGLYLHVGSRYIPATFLGFLAPSMILGYATYHGLNNEDNASGSVAAKIGDVANTVFNTSWRAYSGNSLIGADNQIQKAVVAAGQSGSKVDAKDVAATAAGQVVGQYIPAATSDVNSFLNNGLGLNGKGIPAYNNPNHEAALTKATKTNPDSGRQIKDYPRTAFNQVLNRIPGVSQHLPRKAGVAADDFVDRVTRGDRETGTEVAAQKVTADKAAQGKADTVANIPNPDESNFDQKVQARVEDGNYEAAIAGLKQKMASNEKDPNIPKSKSADLDKQIKQLEVTKAGAYEPKTIDLYKKTSLSEWRVMGDSESDNYDPATYALLLRYDNELAKAGVSANTTKGTSNKFSVKEDKAGKNSALNKIKSNTLGSTPSLPKVSFGDLAPKKITDVKIPTIQQVKAGDLIKKRKITVNRG